jgi:hypothetical protein
LEAELVFRDVVDEIDLIVEGESASRRRRRRRQDIFAVADKILENILENIYIPWLKG